MFVRNPIVRTLNGKPTLMVRAANARQNVIAEATAKLRLLQDERSPEGYTLYKIRDLTLVRSEHPIFLLGWILMHVIDETSPLFGATAASLAAGDALLLLTIGAPTRPPPRPCWHAIPGGTTRFAGGIAMST